MEIPRMYLLVLGKYYDLGPRKGTKDLENIIRVKFHEISSHHLVENHDFSLQTVFTTKWVHKVIL